MDILCTYKVNFKSKKILQVMVKFHELNPNHDHDHPPKLQIKIYMTWMFFNLQNPAREPKILNNVVSKASYHIQIKIMMLNSSQEYLSAFEVSNQDLKDMDSLCASKIKI